jgi:tetratricopeptide (TPR) repeat protein
MIRLFACILMVLLAASGAAAGTTAPEEVRDLYFGEALYYAFQEEWFDAISRLDTELTLHHGLDEPNLDTLYFHIDHAEFAVGDFELAYRMHQRAGRAIKAVIEGNVEAQVRNEAIYRLAKMYFQKDQPRNALFAVERINGKVAETIGHDLDFLRAQILMANGRFENAAEILRSVQNVKRLQGFSTYNLGIALIRSGKEKEGRLLLDRTGQIGAHQALTIAIRDKSNLVLGSKLMAEDNFEAAKLILDRVRLEGPFSNRALLGSGWADASLERYERALVPWSLLAKREATDRSVQEGLLALPYAYGKLNVHSKAAVLYGQALEKFNAQVDKLEASIKSIREGHFLKALVREELKQDANWVVKLRQLPQTPETFYLLELMASHDFQESLKNYLDLEALRKRLAAWEEDLAAFEEIIATRRAYYAPLLPAIDHRFRQLDSQMRLRLEQRDHIEQRLNAMLTSPRPDYLATSLERVANEQMIRMERQLTSQTSSAAENIRARIRRLRGAMQWKIDTEYDHRFTEAHKHLRDLNAEVDLMKKQYAAFVRTRQAATQSYAGYDRTIVRLHSRIRESSDKVKALMARQGHQIEVMAVNELRRRRDRLSEFQIKARFAMADSYDRATTTRTGEGLGK